MKPGTHALSEGDWDVQEKLSEDRLRHFPAISVGYNKHITVGGRCYLLIVAAP